MVFQPVMVIVMIMMPVSAINDQDGDGFSSCLDDCDDSGANTFQNIEVEDGIDNNCDGTIDEGTNAYDDDGDGCNENQGDCDDTDSNTFPGAAPNDSATACMKILMMMTMAIHILYLAPYFLALIVMMPIL